MFASLPLFFHLKHSQQYRRRDPVDADETEFMDNLFNSLCSALSEASIKKLFLDAEGPDLMILMMKSIPFVMITSFHSHIFAEKNLNLNLVLSRL